MYAPVMMPFAMDFAEKQISERCLLFVAAFPLEYRPMVYHAEYSAAFNIRFLCEFPIV